MILQRVLDDLRVDIVAAADDQLLAPPGQPEIAVRVLPAEIAGVEPFLAIDLDPQAGVVPRVEIATKDVRPVDEDGADLIGVSAAGEAPCLVEDSGDHLLIGDAESDRSRAPLT